MLCVAQPDKAPSSSWRAAPAFAEWICFSRITHSLRAMARAPVSDSLGKVAVVYRTTSNLGQAIDIAQAISRLSLQRWRSFPGNIHKVKELIHIWLCRIAQDQAGKAKPLFDDLKY